MPALISTRRHVNEMHQSKQPRLWAKHYWDSRCGDPGRLRRWWQQFRFNRQCGPSFLRVAHRENARRRRHRDCCRIDCRRHLRTTQRGRTVPSDQSARILPRHRDKADEPRVESRRRSVAAERELEWSLSGDRQWWPSRRHHLLHRIEGGADSGIRGGKHRLGHRARRHHKRGSPGDVGRFRVPRDS